MPGKATVKERGEPVGLDVVAVSASYGRLRALNPIDVTVQPGGLVLIVGPNGAGKSTLVRTLAGLTQSRKATSSWGSGTCRGWARRGAPSRGSC